jgi:hypothetical protein
MGRCRNRRTKIVAPKLLYFQSLVPNQVQQTGNKAGRKDRRLEGDNKKSAECCARMTVKTILRENTDYLLLLPRRRRRRAEPSRQIKNPHWLSQGWRLPRFLLRRTHLRNQLSGSKNPVRSFSPNHHQPSSPLPPG